MQSRTDSTASSTVQRGRTAVLSGAAATGLVLTLVGLAGGDSLLARWDLTGDGLDRVWGQLVGIVDAATGKGVTNFLLGTVLVLSAIAWSLARRRRVWSGGLFYVGAVQLLSTAVADFAKPVFGRPRPFQALVDGGGWADHWFAGPQFGSFPSGHAAFYAGLLLPLALLHPRWAGPLAVLWLIVAGERVLSHDHYPSDVGASLLVAALIAAALSRLVQIEAPTENARRMSFALSGDVA